MGMVSRILFILVVGVVISGCSAMDRFAGMGVVSESKSTFDGSTIVEVSPNTLYAPDRTWGDEH
jgi:hypothetical protein